MNKQGFLKKDILIFSGCEYSLKNKGDLAMFASIVTAISRRGSVSRLFAFEAQKGVFSSISDIQGILSPEIHILQALRRSHLSGSQSTRARLRVWLSGIAFVALYFRYRWFGANNNMHPLAYEFFSRLQPGSTLLFSGGGYLNSLWWSDGMYAKAFAALVARLAGVRVLLTSQGLGPFTHPSDALVARLLFTVASFIGVRDADKSLAVVRQVSPSSVSKVHYTGDDALRLEPISNRDACEQLAEIGIDFNEHEVIAVNFRDSSTYSDGYKQPPFENLAEFLDQLLVVPHRRVVFVPISYHDADGDCVSARKVVSYMKRSKKAFLLEKEHSPETLKGIIGCASFAVGTSYHFSLFALSQSVPVLGLYQDHYYQQKLDGLFSIFEQHSLCINLNLSDVGSLVGTAAAALQARESIRGALKIRADELKQRSSVVHEQLLELLCGSPNT